MKRFRIFLTWVLLVLAAGAELAAAAPSIRTAWAYGRAYSNLYDMTRQFGLQLRVGKGRYDVTGNGSRMVLYPDKRYMFLNGVRVNQCFSQIGRAHV